jgi:type II secretory pathway pseudopilin PulG
MVHRRQNGFTIIEVLMFLAVSGLLLMGMLATLNGSINNSRFNDAVNSTTSFLQSQYGEVTTGRNSRLTTLGCVNGVVNATPSTAGMTNCVIMGRLLAFSVGNSSITSSYIVGKDNTAVSSGDTAAVVAATPVIAAGNTDETYSIPWSTQINTMKSNGVDVNYLAIIRSPVSERVLLYSFQGAANLTSLTNLLIKDSNLNQPVDVCLRDSGIILGRVGYVRIGAGQGQDVMRTDLTATTGTCT